MADTNRDGISTLYHDSAAPKNLCYPTTDEPAGQKRTRSQLNVPDLILRLPLSRSPLKDARKARAKARGTSPILQSDSQLHTPGAPQSPTVERGEAVAGVVIEAGIQEAVYRAGEEEDSEMETCADGLAHKYEEEEGKEDGLFSPASHGGKGHNEDSNSNQSQHTMWPTSTKKRPSPDTDAMRALSSPGSHRQSKRAKVEAFRILGRGQEHSEYHEPLRDPEASTPSRSKGYRRASSTKPTPSPSKVASSIFPPRAQSVPLGGENEARAVDLTSIPPSPRRSPSKGAVEIRRAPSVPPTDGDRMDVDPGDTSALLQFTNPTQLPTPLANPVFRYTVNFATPRGSATPPRSGFPFASPLSPLTPLSSSPFTERLPEMQSLLAKKANAKLLVFDDNMDADTDTPTGSMVIPPVADTTASMDMFQPAAHVFGRALPAASTSRSASAAPGFSTASQSRLARLILTSSNLTELMPPPTAPERENDSMGAITVAGDSGQAKDVSSNNSGGAGKVLTGASVDLSSAPSSRPGSSAMLISRPSIIGAMKPKRGPSIPQGPRRVTRSVSMKEQRVKGERAETEDTTVSSYTVEVPVATTSTVAGPSSEVTAMPPPSSTVTSKPRPPKSTGAVNSKSRPPPTAHRSASVSKLPPDPSKLKQTSLNIFIKAKPSPVPAAATGSSTTSTSTSTGSLLRVVPPLSPSKLPLPVSPSKRPSTSQPGKIQPSLFSLGSTDTGVGTGTSRGTSGRSLTTLSHALDKLVVPPPSRPNTSMGFVRAEGTSEEESTPENSKGKWKAKDDASLPTTQGSRTTFARPTASSLKRAATVTGFGSTAATRMRGRGGAAVGGLGKGRGAVGIFGKTGDRASKKTSLPVVAGSPVKGSGGTDDLDRDGWGAGKHRSRLSLGGAKDAGGVTGEEDVFVSQDAMMQDVSAESSMGGGGSAASQKPSPPPATNASNGIEIDLTTSPVSADKGKQRAVPSSTLNPASSALHALSESLSSLPQTPTPPKPRAIGTRTGLRSSSAAAGKESPALDGSGSVVPGGNSEVHGSGGAGPGDGTVNGSGGVKKSSLKILKRCAIFVDVRTEQGDDAGSLFVDMLRGLGAKIMGRLGQSCTHIVYKNGLPNTLTRYRMLNDPKPVVVGIAWVVECAEKRAKVDEERFKIDVDMINVAGGNNKRRRSMLPKHLIPVSPGPGYEMSMHMSSEADDDDEGAGGTDGSPSQDPDISIRSREEDDLPPLERARRRRSILPGGQTRLVPY